jgi:hypothetical protein
MNGANQSRLTTVWAKAAAANLTDERGSFVEREHEQREP